MDLLFRDMVPTGSALLARMDKNLVRRELLRLKNEAFPKDDAGFLRASRLYHSTIAQVENRTVPGVVNLERWVNACGMSLSTFFAHIEAVEAGKRPKKEDENPAITSVRRLVQRGADAETLKLVVQWIDRLAV